MLCAIIAAAVILVIHQNESFSYLVPKPTSSPLNELQVGDLYGICAPIEHLKELNKEIHPTLQKLTLTPFFRTYRVNMERECPFWAQQRLCNNHKCSVCECSDEEIPSFWRSQSL